MSMLIIYLDFSYTIPKIVDLDKPPAEIIRHSERFSNYITILMML